MSLGSGAFDSLNDEAREIFDMLQKDGPLSKSELSLFTKMKLTTMSRIMQPLEESGLIVQSEVGESTGGRKPALYDANNAKYYVVGVDISRTYTQIVITSMKMDVLGRKNFSMEATCSPEKTVKLISQAIHETIKELDIDMGAIIGVGLGTVGPLDRKKGTIINPVHFEAPGWVNVPIKELMENELGCSVFVDNGASTAVMAEKFFGIGKNIENVVYFNCGIGIRTGAISAGNIVRTINDAEDAFGHMVIDVDGEECNCGNFGCIECYSSIFAIVRKFISELKKGRNSSVTKPIKDINYLDVCAAGEQNDPLACEIITGAAVVLGTGLANFINLLNPGLIILSGPLIQNSKLFYQACTETALKKCYLAKEGNILFSKGGYFEESAIAIGAAAMVVEYYLKSRIIA